MLTSGNYHCVAFNCLFPLGSQCFHLCQPEGQWAELESAGLFLRPVHVYFVQVMTSSLSPEGYHLSSGCLMFYSLIKLISSFGKPQIGGFSDENKVVAWDQISPGRRHPPLRSVECPKRELLPTHLQAKI